MGPRGIGLPGPTGSPGLTGCPGKDGSIGPRGFTGKHGTTGPCGPPLVITDRGVKTVVVTDKVGPQGPTGCHGSVGCSGPTGCQGPIGLQGPKGCSGNNGQRGPTGPDGTPCQCQCQCQNIRGIDTNISVINGHIENIGKLESTTHNEHITAIKPFISYNLVNNYLQLWGCLEYAGTGNQFIKDDIVEIILINSQIGLNYTQKIDELGSGGIYSTCMNVDNDSRSLTGAVYFKNLSSGTVCLKVLTGNNHDLTGDISIDNIYFQANCKVLIN
jgi:hypothetical protein